MPRPPVLSPELLQTFVAVVQADGDAAEAARSLNVNQPSMSKRLAQLQHAGRILKRPWLTRVGKRWVLTPEGQRLLPAVRDLIRRYEQVSGFAAGPAGLPDVNFACGREMASDFVLSAVRRFRARWPSARLRIAASRGAARIAGVANGELDLACVTHEPAEIREIARRELAIDELRDDPLVLAAPQTWAEPVPAWWSAFLALPTKGGAASSLAGLPLLLPEPDAGLRRALDARLEAEGVASEMEIVLEVGGWSTLLAYAREGLGVALLPASIAAREDALAVRALPSELAIPNRVRLITRWQKGSDGERDLTELAAAFRVELLTAGGTR